MPWGYKSDSLSGAAVGWELEIPPRESWIGWSGSLSSGVQMPAHDEELCWGSADGVLGLSALLSAGAV